MGIDPRAVGIEKGFFSGDAGSRCPVSASGSRSSGHARADMYGTGELGLHSGECEHRQGLHFGGTGFAVVELIDPDTGRVLDFRDGQTGEVVYTSIQRDACPLQRMRSHDLIQVFTERCDCGRADSGSRSSDDPTTCSSSRA